MDAYHEVLVKLLEVTDGKITKSVDFQDLVKKVGFYGNYPEIFERLSQEGWIAEDMKADFVRITHWGVAEAKKSSGSSDSDPKKTSKNAAKCVIMAHEFIKTMENYAADASKDNLKKAENKFSELENTFNLAKTDSN